MNDTSGVAALSTTPTSNLAPSSINATTTKSQPPHTTFVDTDLTGCYAGTGGSTVFTASSGAYIPSGTLSYKMATAQETLTIDCQDFMSLPFVPFSVASSFMRASICTSYANVYQSELIANHGTATGYEAFPPGMFNMMGYNDWLCCGGCHLSAPTVSVLYWSTMPASDCATVHPTMLVTSSAMLPTTTNNPQKRDVSSFAYVNGSTL